MLAEPFSTHVDAPAGDPIVLLSDATWADYQRLLELRGERRSPRLAYLEGVLELRSPSKEHELLKSWIGRLVEVWCLEQGVEFAAYGSWTLESKQADRGVEPDECYVFGRVSAPERPDLAIEVVWTAGGLDKRDIYRKLGVPELWTWRRGGFTICVLRGDTYLEVPNSAVLPGINLEELAGFLDRPTTSQAIREYRAALQARQRQ